MHGPEGRSNGQPAGWKTCIACHCLQSSAGVQAPTNKRVCRPNQQLQATDTPQRQAHLMALAMRSRAAPTSTSTNTPCTQRANMACPANSSPQGIGHDKQGGAHIHKHSAPQREASHQGRHQHRHLGKGDREGKRTSKQAVNSGFRGRTAPSRAGASNATCSGGTVRGRGQQLSKERSVRWNGGSTA